MEKKSGLGGKSMKLDTKVLWYNTNHLSYAAQKKILPLVHFTDQNKIKHEFHFFLQ